MTNVNYSIIIPHYNDLSGIKRLLKSIPNRKDIEVVIVDDNSETDYDLLKSTCISVNKNKYSFYKNNKKYHSAGRCRNIGLKNSRGKWIIFIDSDDFFTKDAFSIIDKYLDSEYDFVVFQPTSVIIPSMKMGTRHLQYEKLIKNYKKRKCRRNKLNILYGWAPVVSKIYNRSRIINSKIVFDETFVGNDKSFSLKCAINSKENFKIDDRIIYIATMHDNSLTSVNNEDRLRIRFSIWLKNYILLKETIEKKDFYYLRFNILYYFKLALTNYYIRLLIYIFIKCLSINYILDKIIYIFILIKENMIGEKYE